MDSEFGTTLLTFENSNNNTMDSEFLEAPVAQEGVGEAVAAVEVAAAVAGAVDQAAAAATMYQTLTNPMFN